MDFGLFLSDLPSLALASAAATIIIFPIVFAMTIVYDWLVERNERTPKFLFMLLCTFLGVLLFAVLLYWYVGSTLQEVIASTAAQ
jgi:ATP/ADP translocase